MGRFFLRLLWLTGWVALSGCVDRYTPDVPPAAQANLVVDGFINLQGPTVIKLSRTFSVNTKNTAPAEARARVAIADDAGQRYPLAESPTGTYTSAALALNPSRQYQLLITTAQGRDYASDLAPTVPTPPVDSITWRLTPVEGIQIYLTTHDASTAARYYRWEYEETYQYTSAFQSSLEYVASTNSLAERPADKQIFTCWRTEPSTAILQSNTAQLSQNTLANFPLLTVLPSQKLRLGYSLLVRQYAQTQAEYDYWERLRKSTENLGTVNDPLPARVTGNVHALADAAEPVLGYVGVHSVAQKRLFVDGAKLPVPRPTSVLYNPFYASCTLADRVLPNAYYLQQFRDGFLIPINHDLKAPEFIYVSTPSCVDCRQWGTSVKPSFWP
jgi:hypothetical protein